MPGLRRWTVDPQLACRIYRPEFVPRFNFRALPAHVQIRMLDGGFWLIDIRTGIRYRRITMADLPNKACFANGASRRRSDDEEEDEDEVASEP